jgi:hypothetical protein
MIEIPLIDELFEIRLRLTEEAGRDAVRYAEMLRQVSRDLPGTYLTQAPWSESPDGPHPSRGR